MNRHKAEAEKQTAKSSNGDRSFASCEGGNDEELMHAGSGSAGGDEVPSHNAATNLNLNGEEEDEEGKGVEESSEARGSYPVGEQVPGETAGNSRIPHRRQSPGDQFTRQQQMSTCAVPLGHQTNPRDVLQIRDPQDVAARAGANCNE